MTSESAPRKLEIRKYANRRYYDSTHSRHLTLEEIRTLVEQGYDIQVSDAKTKADITGQVLIQIILELDTVKLDSLPVPLLVHLIRVNDQLIKSFVENYLYKALQAFTEYQGQWQEQLRTAGNAFPGMSAWTNAMLRPFAPSSQSSEEPPRATQASREGGREDLHEVVRDLQKQVAELRKGRRSRTGAGGRKRRTGPSKK